MATKTREIESLIGWENFYNETEPIKETFDVMVMLFHWLLTKTEFQCIQDVNKIEIEKLIPQN